MKIKLKYIFENRLPKYFLQKGNENESYSVEK